MTPCAKAPYPSHAKALESLAIIVEKWGSKPRNKMPKRAYPCDISGRTAWHLTSRKYGKRKPPWDRDPNWQRPNASTLAASPLPQRPSTAARHHRAH